VPAVLPAPGVLLAGTTRRAVTEFACAMARNDGRDFMNIVVCVKPVPDISIISPDPVTGHINSDDLVYIINHHDMAAVEEAVRIKEMHGPGKVTLITVAPPSTKRLLRRCLAIGADDAMLLWDKSFVNCDSYVTGVILARAIASLRYDLILCGQKAIDTEAGQAGSVIAARLDIPLATRVARIEVSPDNRRVTIESKLEKGNRAKIEIDLPAVLTVESDLNEPRYASLPSLTAGLRKGISEHNLESLGLSSEEVGMMGAKTITVALALPKPRPKKVFTPDASLSAEERLRLIMSGGVTQKHSDILKGDPGKIAARVVQYLRQKNLLRNKT
jgi:electron transfer flavoprotein beta subunit